MKIYINYIKISVINKIVKRRVTVTATLENDLCI